jgi:hypothetical protein
VNLRRDLYDHSCACNGQQGTPEVLHRMLGVDMANIAESERNSSDRNSDGEESRRDRPTEALRPVKELLSRRDIPADLEMHRKSTYEDPNCH